MSEPADAVTDALVQFHGAILPLSWVRTIENTLERVTEIKPIILIRGEPGTGRDTMARVIHAASPRRHQPFVKIRCGLRPVDRLTAELFGHERDAFPGAGRRRIGRLEFAHRGTLLLDEVEDLPGQLERALIHVLRDGEMYPPGDPRRAGIDIQVIATTGRMLRQSGSVGGLEDADLLKVVDVILPPLRARRHDIVSLVVGLLAQYNAAYGRRTVLRADTLAALSEYEWPGNVRELAGAIRQAVIAGDESVLRRELKARSSRPPSVWQTA
jgi:DNA-binding NtrC family response regulator